MSKILRKIILIMVPITLLGMGGQALAQDDVNCNKCVDTSDIAKGAINASKIEKNAVNGGKIAKDAVTTTKIKGGSVTESKLAPGVPSKMKQGGYDLSNRDVFSAFPAENFDSPSFGGQGNTKLTLKGGEDVLLIGSVQVMRHPADTENGDVVQGSLIPCVWNTEMDVEAEGAVFVPGYDTDAYNAITPICMTSTGADDAHSVATSYLFQNLDAGKYEFGLCPSKWNDGGCDTLATPDFVVFGTKIALIKTN